MEVKKCGKRKKRNVDGEQKRSGFTKPTKVPKKIAEFLGLADDAVLPRTEVTKHIYEYIKTNKLQMEEDKKKSYTDKKLSELFDLPEKSVIEFSTF
jgi:chromatin remodeling complex protein RSC6